MGLRTVLMLSNNHAHEWQNDPELGKKIARAMNHTLPGDTLADIENYGRVVQCVHADEQTIVVLSEYRSCQNLATLHWQRDESTESVALKLLKAAADRMGFRLVRKPPRR